MPRVIRIIQSLKPSGRTLSALAIHSCLRGAGFEQELWVLEKPNDETVAAADRQFRRSPGIDLGLLMKLRSSLKQAAPQIVHTHGTAADVYGVLSARLAGVPRVLLTCHRGDQSQERIVRKRWRNQFVYGRVDRVVCISTWQMKHLRGVYDGPADKWRRIYNGLDLSVFLSLKFPGQVSHPRPIVLCTAHLRRDRDHPMLLKAFALAAASAPGAELWLAGTGEESYVNELRCLAAELGFADRVRFLGLRRDIPTLLAKATVVVQPAVAEALGRSLVEAAAAARPIVASRVGGIPEVVRDGLSGRLHEPSDVQGFADSIAQLVSDRQMATRMGRAGRKWVAERFSFRHMKNAYMALYNELLGA
jgi:glycosyltransferase involved in cell wall biosynthesis